MSIYTFSSAGDLYCEGKNIGLFTTAFPYSQKAKDVHNRDVVDEHGDAPADLFR